MKQKIMTLVPLCLALLIGWFGGQLWEWEQGGNLPISKAPYPEMTIIEFKGLAGDQLELEVFGPARLVWSEDRLIDETGVQLIPLGQIATPADLKFAQFAYTANAKTGKFYPSTSYPARGTAVRDRRFFQTKQGAITAGFIPTKLVK